MKKINKSHLIKASLVLVFCVAALSFSSVQAKKGEVGGVFIEKQDKANIVPSIEEAQIQAQGDVGALWVTSIKYLTPKEKASLNDLIGIGLERDYVAKLENNSQNKKEIESVIRR